MAQRLEKPWQELTAENAKKLSGQLGVYEICDAAGRTRKFGAAHARLLFGLRSALQDELARLGPGHRFRVEVNTMYRTRWAELLMVYRADHDVLPEDNVADARVLGRLSPGPPPGARNS